jgi:Cu+-exporting ATPase
MEMMLQDAPPAKARPHTKIDKALCHHCNTPVVDANIRLGEYQFCCTGCKTVYQFLHQNNLCEFYAIDANAGLPQRAPSRQNKFSFLDSPDIAASFVSYSNATETHASFYLPQMHCSSCLWLLEHLSRVNNGILSSRVNFQKKEIVLIFQHKLLTIRQVAEILTQVGYEPHMSLQQFGKANPPTPSKRRTYQLGTAAFCFANIMLLSFPAYFGLDQALDGTGLSQWFRWAIFGLSLPVFFFSAQDFFKSGFTSIKKGVVNIDAPIALAILITFCRSAYEIFSGSGEGYLDSMAGIVFFMLIGRALQDRTTEGLSFERDYASYFPIAVGKMQGGVEVPTPLSDLVCNDHIIIYNNEIIPADGLLIRGNASIDYSFVTGESLPEQKQIGDLVYAGGKQTKGTIELMVVRPVTQSYLTKLWQNDAMKATAAEDDSYIHLFSKYFSVVLFAIAAATGLYWWSADAAKLWPAVTAVLIVACPCSLLLSSTFTNGHLIRILDKHRFFVRNANVLERMAKIDTVVFDKTGTLTQSGEMVVHYAGKPLSPTQKRLLASVAAQSSHPLSKSLFRHLHTEAATVHHFSETLGKGCSGWVEGQRVVLGSSAFVFGNAAPGLPLDDGTEVAFSIDKSIEGKFGFTSALRPGITGLLTALQKKYTTRLLSGDWAGSGYLLKPFFGAKEMLFQQSPEDKLNEIVRLKRQNAVVMMVGDGLNDAGALKLADVGIAVTDNANNFCPASDAILDAAQLPNLERYMQLARAGKRIVVASFVLSIIYNLVGLGFAVQGSLQPLIAAILMPASSISIVLFTWLAARFSEKKLL